MTLIVSRHPDAATLMSYAAGTLAEPLAAVVVAHVDLCEHCRDAVADLELMGAALMLSGRSRDTDGARAPSMPHTTRKGAATHGRSGRDGLPAPIVAAYGLSLAAIPWKRLGPGVWHHRLALSEGTQGDLRLLKIGPGRTMPEHGHGGAELTLVLDGAYSDVTGDYRRGDIQDVDEGIEHTPVSDPTAGCICLIASEKPARFRGVIGRLLQPWTGM